MNPFTDTLNFLMRAEWPWTYFFLILLQLTFVVYAVGRSLGLDAVLHRRGRLALRPKGTLAYRLTWLT